jgi:polar amino acid transport system substrate-binding protein
LYSCRDTNIKILLIVLLCFSSFCSAKQQDITFLAEELPPYHFTDNEGNAQGALVDVIHALMKQTQVVSKIEILPFARSYELTKSRPNTFMFSLLKTPNRNADFQWIGETYKSYAILVGMKARQDIKLIKLQDAQSLMVGTIRGYHSAYYLQENGFKEKQNLSLSVTSKHMWAMLFKGRIDLVLTNYMALDRDIKKAGFDPAKISPYLALQQFPNRLFIATGPKTNKKIIAQLRQGLETIKENGTYNTILSKWSL